MPVETFDDDIRRIKNWVLATGELSYTFPHADGSGVETWVQGVEGEKWWGVEVPNLLSDDPLEALAKYREIARVCHDYCLAPDRLSELATVHLVKVEPGMILYVAFTLEIERCD